MRRSFIRDISLYSLGSSDYYSHPGRLLRDHLTGVSDKALALLSASRMAEMGVCSAKDVMEASLCHDLGKMHPETVRYFAAVAAGEYMEGKKIPHHSLSGAIAALISGADPWIAEIIRRHHGHIEDSAASREFWSNDDMTFENVSGMLEEYFPGIEGGITSEEWQCLQDSAFLGLKASARDWARVRAVTSVFIAADRMDAAGVQEFSTPAIPDFVSPAYIHARKTPLDQWRAGLREACIEKARRVDRPGLYSITLPTGSGKTNIGVECAHMIAGAVGAKRIIYALPFISIVDQNYARTVEMMGGNERVQPDHSQRSPEVDMVHGETIPIKRHVNRYRFWDRPVVVTTMAHLWDVIFSPTTHRVQNFHALANSVVLMDEPQTVPSRYWNGFETVAKYLSSHFNVTFIFMTATQPSFSLGVTPIAPEGVKPMHPRWRLNLAPSPPEGTTYGVSDIPWLVQTFLKRLLPKDTSSGLVSLSTKRAVIGAYRAICCITDPRDVFCLSGWMTHSTRRAVMAEIVRREAAQERRILAATQVIEAGADLDFHWVFSDIKPLTSLVQILGRLNRHLRSIVMGEALVADVIDERGRAYSSYVYDPHIELETTHKILVDNCPFTESDMEPLVNRFHHELAQKKCSVAIWEMIQNGAWAQIPPLVDETRDDIVVYVETDETVRDHLERLMDREWCRTNPGKFRWRSQDLRRYEIRVSARHVEAWLGQEEKRYFKEISKGHYLISSKGIGRVYSTRVGFLPYLEAQALGLLDDDEALRAFHSRMPGPDPGGDPDLSGYEPAQTEKTGGILPRMARLISALWEKFKGVC